MLGSKQKDVGDTDMQSTEFVGKAAVLCCAVNVNHPNMSAQFSLPLQERRGGDPYPNPI